MLDESDRQNYNDYDNYNNKRMNPTTHTNTMRQNISMIDLRKSAGNVFDHVRLKGDTYIVERNKKPIGVITSIEADNEYQKLIAEKVQRLERQIHDDIAVTQEEYDFLVEHANYPKEDHLIYCNQQHMDTLSHFGGAANLETLESDTLEKWIAESEEEK